MSNGLLTREAHIEALITAIHDKALHGTALFSFPASRQLNISSQNTPCRAVYRYGSIVNLHSQFATKIRQSSLEMDIIMFTLNWKVKYIFKKFCAYVIFLVSDLV